MIFHTFIFFKSLIATFVAIKYAVITRILAKKCLSDTNDIVTICTNAIHATNKTAGNLYTISILDNARILAKNTEDINIEDLNYAFHNTIDDAKNCVSTSNIYAATTVAIAQNINNTNNNVKIFANATEFFAASAIKYASYLIDPYINTAINMAFLARSAAVIANNDTTYTKKFCDNANLAAETAINSANSASNYLNSIVRISNKCATDDDVDFVCDITSKIHKY